MKKRLKKIAASVMAVATMAAGMTSVTANADSYDFDFNLGRGGQRSTSAIKYNFFTLASIKVDDGTLSDSAYMYLCLKYSSGTKISGNNPIYNTGGYNIFYTSKPSQDSSVILQGDAGYYSVRANGSWTP